jgi:hypothetical protein
VIPVVGTVRAMDTTEQQADPQQTDDAQDGGSPAQSVRVPNVSPNAKSGLDHTVIGSNALADAGDRAEALAWVTAGEDDDETRERADAVWAKFSDDDAESETNAALAADLRSAVYGEGTAEPNGQGESDDTGLSVAADSQVPGTVEQTEGTPGPAEENADTGQVTQSGEPLPDAPAGDDAQPIPAQGIEGDGRDGSPLDADQDGKVDAANPDPAATDADES